MPDKRILLVMVFKPQPGKIEPFVATDDVTEWTPTQIDKKICEENPDLCYYAETNHE